jgi:outer membrane protein assembly factor BamB
VPLDTVWERDIAVDPVHVDADASRVYAADDDEGALLALDAATGDTVWALPADGSDVAAGTDPHDGTVYVAIAAATEGPRRPRPGPTDLLVAVAQTGDVRWTVDLPAPPASFAGGGHPATVGHPEVVPPDVSVPAWFTVRPGRETRTVRNGMVPGDTTLATRDALFLQVGGGPDDERRIVAVDRSSGRRRWISQAPDGLVAATDGVVVGYRKRSAFDADNAALVARDAVTGHEAWTYESDADPPGRVAHHDGRLCVGDETELVTVDLVDGRRSTVAVDDPVRHLLIADGHLCVVRGDYGDPGRLRCRDIDADLATTCVLDASPEMSAGGLLFGQGGTRLVDPTTGHRWSYRIPDVSPELHTVTHDTVYVATGPMQAHVGYPPTPTVALDRASGDSRWTFVHAGPVWVGTGIVYARDDTTLYALDPTDGTALGSLELPGSTNWNSADFGGPGTLRRVGDRFLVAGETLRLVTPPGTSDDGTGTRVFGDGPAYCPACGVDLAARDAAFCPACGTGLNDR